MLEYERASECLKSLEGTDALKLMLIVFPNRTELRSRRFSESARALLRASGNLSSGSGGEAAFTHQEESWSSDTGCLGSRRSKLQKLAHTLGLWVP